MITRYPLPALSGLLVVFLLVPALSAQNLRLSNFDIATIRERLPLAMDSADVPGLSLAWFGDSSFNFESFGYRNVEQQLLAQENSIFEAASLSKPVTAYLTLRLAERGILHLDAPIIQLVPKTYLAEHFFKGPYPGEIFNLVTPRILLTHSTGFPNWRRRGAALDFYFVPGTDFHYSGEGFMLLQLVLEYLTNKPLDRLARTYVFDPLNMDNSSFVYQEEFKNQLTEGYHEDGKKQPIHHYEKPAAAYSLLTTASDYLKFMEALLEGKGLSPESMEDMLRPQQPVNYGAPGQYHWGLGIGLEKTAYGQIFWHWGDNGPFKCFMVGLPAQKKAVVFLTNSSNGLALGELIIKKGLGIPTTTFGHLEYPQYNSAAFQIQKILRTANGFLLQKAFTNIFSATQKTNIFFTKRR
ncbi:MAG: serine hydrolase domain-containing protein [Bacteroidia bacterium]